MAASKKRKDQIFSRVDNYSQQRRTNRAEQEFAAAAEHIKHKVRFVIAKSVEFKALLSTTAVVTV